MLVDGGLGSLRSPNMFSGVGTDKIETVLHFRMFYHVLS